MKIFIFCFEIPFKIITFTLYLRSISFTLAKVKKSAKWLKIKQYLISAPAI